MARSPYLLKDGSNILSKFGSRAGITPRVWELRLDMNGWRAQHLIHNVSRFDEVTADDLAAYATDRKVKPVSHAVDSVLAAIRGSTPLSLSRTYDGRIAITNRVVGYCQERTAVDLNALASKIEALKSNAGVFRAQVSYPEHSAYATVISGIWSKWQRGVNARAHTATFRVKGFNRDTSRFDDPVGTFQAMVAEHLRIPVDQVVFHGRGLPGNLSGSSGGIAPNYTQFCNAIIPTAGYTVLYSPFDLEGYCGIFVVPKIPGVKAALLNIRLGLRDAAKIVIKDGTLTIPSADLVASGTCPQALNDPYAYNLWRVWDASPAYTQCHVVADGSPVGGSTTAADYNLDAAVHENLGSPTLLTRADNGNWGQYKAGHDASLVQLGGLFYASPNGFKDVLLNAPALSLASVASGYGDVLAALPIKVNATLKMQAVRAYMLAKSKDPSLSEVDKASLARGLSESEKYADALLYCTVYHNGWDYPRQVDIENLSIVKAAADADKDLMTEDLGKGVTFRKAAVKFEALRNKGTKAFAAVCMVDDALSASDVVSPLISNRYHPWLWLVEPVFTDGAIVAYRGYYNGGNAESITADDAVALVTNGSGVRLAAGLTLDRVYADLGLEPEKLGVYGSMFSHALPDAYCTAYDGVYSIQPMAMAPRDFRDASGYPVLDIVENDARYRAMLVFKGLGEDLQGMFLTLFFLNELDMK